MTTVDPPGAVCKSCPAPVFWAETVTGKPMLVDAEPVRGGNLRLEQRPGRAPIAYVVAKHIAWGQTLHVSHFSTCPQAGSHRKRGAA